MTDLTSLSGLIDTYRTLSVEQLLDRDLIVRFLRLAHALGAREMAQQGVERLQRLNGQQQAIGWRSPAEQQYNAFVPTDSEDVPR